MSNDVVYATSPVIIDAADKDTLDFAEAYSGRFGREPGWTAVKYYEAAQAAMAALGSVEIRGEWTPPANLLHPTEW